MRIESGVRHGCVKTPWFFNMYMDAVMKEVKVGIANKVSGGGKRVEIVWSLVCR